jgi:uncharacterized membrane protein YcaP (DUF421 family)
MHWYDFLFENPAAIVKVIVVGMLDYLTLLALLRITGKRSLSKWNAYDLVVTVAIGSTLANAILSRTSTWAEASAGMGLLVAVQYIIARAAVRHPTIRRWFNSTPAILLRNGKLLDEALRREKVSEGEVLAAVRHHGIAAVEDVAAVILETDGNFSVIPEVGPNGVTAMADVIEYVPRKEKKRQERRRKDVHENARTRA